MIGEVELPLFTFGRFCDIIKVIRKLIGKLEFDKGGNSYEEGNSIHFDIDLYNKFICL